MLEVSAGSGLAIDGDVWVDDPAPAVTVVSAVLVMIGVTVTVTPSPPEPWDPVGELAAAELGAEGAAPPSALATVASSQQPICTPATVFMGRA